MPCFHNQISSLQIKFPSAVFIDFFVSLRDTVHEIWVCVYLTSTNTSAKEIQKLHIDPTSGGDITLSL